MPADKCKLPVYFAYDPVMLFCACKAYFTMHKVIKGAEKAALVVYSLPKEQLQAQAVAHLLTKEENLTSYANIKSVLHSLAGLSFQESIEKFLELLSLQTGDKPSSYL